MLKSKLSKLALAMLAVAGMAFLAGTAMGDPDVEGLKKIADLVKKGDMAAAKKAAAEYAKKNADVEDIMEAFKPAKKKGIGVTGVDQGIEQTLNKIGRDTPSPTQMTKLGKAYEEMGYNVAAVGLVVGALAPEKDSGKKTRKAWQEWADGMVESGQSLAKAAQGGAGAAVKAEATKVNNNCNSCHSTFK